jgi:hypothetical protein
MTYSCRRPDLVTYRQKFEDGRMHNDADQLAFGESSMGVEATCHPMPLMAN